MRSEQITRPTHFKVVDGKRNHLWVEVLEGDDKGIRVSVPQWHQSYSASLQKQIDGLDGGEIVELALVRSDLNWRIKELEVVKDV